VRLAPVVANIEDAVNQDLSTLASRLQVTDKDSADYLKSECLVHLIRDAQRRDDREAASAIVPVLLGRCEAILKSKVDGATIPNAEALRDDILGEFALLLVRDGEGENADELDFYECRFNLAFRSLRIDMIRKERDQRRRFVRLNTRPPNGDDDDIDGHPEELIHSDTPPGLDQVTIDDILEKLPRELQKAYVLRYRMGFEVESKEKSKTTVATLCGVTGRTVRDWLREIKQLLTKEAQEEV
jgi:hypothetical protein